MKFPSQVEPHYYHIFLKIFIQSQKQGSSFKPVRWRKMTLLNILSGPRTRNCRCPHVSCPLLFALSVLCPFVTIPPRRTSVCTSFIGSNFSLRTKCFAIWCISVRNICPWWNASGWGTDKNGMSLRHQSGIIDAFTGFIRTIDRCTGVRTPRRPENPHLIFIILYMF